MLLILAINLFLSLGSCSSKIDSKGYIFDSLDFSSIQKNVTSKNTILNNFGSPSFYSDVSNKEYWFYYSNQVKKFLFFQPKIISRDVLILSFNDNNVVDFIKILNIGDQDSKYFFNINKTEVKGHEKGIFKSIFENIGTIKNN